MNQEELTMLNLGESLDSIMNVDPRGYGVCKILYSAAREYTKEPLTMNSAKKLIGTLKEGDIVYLMVGFVLLPLKKAEMDGIVSTMLLARTLVKGFNVKPVIVCPQDNMKAVRNMSSVVGLHFQESIEDLKEYPLSLTAVPFTKDANKADKQADELIEKACPSAVISIECPGANSVGVYHNAIGMNVTDIESKEDHLFRKLRNKGILNIAIGDLGNETGMGTLKEHIQKYVPYAAKGTCSCGCGGGILADTKADNIITATLSDWGCYGLIAAIAYLKKNLELMHTPKMEEEVLVTASRSGMIDMYGDLIPAIDGCNSTMIISVASLMRECVASSLKLQKTCATWFDKVLELGFFEDEEDRSERLKNII